MAKFCASGHQMEDTWEACPYCQPIRLPATRPVAHGRTRTESGTPREPPTSLASRRTVWLGEQRKPPVVGWFVALTGPQAGEDFRIREGPNTVGSSPESDIVLRDPAISGSHASLRYKDRRFTITDLDSTNGTFLNDRSDPIAREELKDNDIVRIGEVKLKFKCL